MNHPQRDLLARVLRTLRERHTLPEVDWDLLIRQARRAGFVARLAIELDAAGLLDAVPAAPRRHLEAERHVAEKHNRDVQWEVRCIKTTLARTGVPIILLKGAAYLMSGSPAARGRIFADIDIMVPAGSLEQVENALRVGGWGSADLDAYDEHYYRRWMHQLPPLSHYSRGTAIDVHHTIVARTRRLHLNAEKLFAAAIPVPGDPELKMLAPADMLLHSAAHLLNEGSFQRGLRDLDDMNLLLRHFSAEPGFWSALIERAAELDLRRPLYYALRYTARLLGTPVPTNIQAAHALNDPAAPFRWFMDALFERALRPDHASCRDALSRLALLLLYVRAHALLMPPHVLLPHLVRKAIMRTKAKEDLRKPLKEPN